MLQYGLSWEHYAKQKKKSHKNDRILYDSIEVKYPEVVKFIETDSRIVVARG